MTSPHDSVMTSFPKSRIKVVLFENIHKNAVESFHAEGFHLVTHAGALSGEDLRKELQDARIVGLRSKTKLTREVLEAAPKLMAIGCFCIGTDQVDLSAAEGLGIPVFNSPFSNSRSVAELIIGNLINLARKITVKSSQMHAGQWSKTATGCVEVRGKTLGIIGYGHIGSQLSVLAEALGMKVIFLDVQRRLPLGNARAVESLEDLLTEADFVTLHVPDTPDTRYMIGEKELNQMKDGAFLLNASRGKVVDLEALRDAILSKKIGGAYVDVFPSEPAKNGDIEAQGVNIPIIGLDNVILTPHIGGSTEEAQAAIGEEVAGKLIDYLNKGSSDSAVNFPHLSPPPLKSNSHRLVNIHANRPGVILALNKIISDLKCNITYQTTCTTEQVGFFMVDVEKEVSKTLLDTIKSTPECHNIKTRLLY